MENNMNQNDFIETSVNMPIRRSFLGKLLFIMLLIGITPAIVNAIFSYSTARSALTQSTNDIQDVIEKDQSAYILSWANERTQDIMTLAGVARIASMDPETASAAIKRCV